MRHEDNTGLMPYVGATWLSGYVPHWHGLNREAFRPPSVTLPKDTCAITPTGGQFDEQRKV